VVLSADAAGTVRLDDTGPVTFVRVAPHAGAVEFSVWLAPGGAEIPPAATGGQLSRAPRWPQVLTTHTTLSAGKDAFVIDDIALPVENPWRRHVRLGDIQFFPDGRAAGVTIDGDVWLIDGLAGDPDQVRWRRFASGLHEPLSLVIRDGEIFVFDRNGLWHLRDTDGDGEADVHELFCNLFAQTSDTREFPNNMKLAPDGSFVLAKGGQRGDTLAKDSGTVLRVAPDGKSVSTLGWGFRQPYVGVHPRTGLVTATDQEGNYVPATPVYALTQNEYHGFLAGFLPVEKYPAPIAKPVVWLPHNFNASGVSQLWLTDAKMGPLNDALIHLGYNRAELFVVRPSERTAERQAAVMSLTRDLPFAPLSGAVNPADGRLYVTGFQIYAATADRISGLARIRPTGVEYAQPREVVAMDQGVLLRFDVALDASRALDPANYRAARWNYQRTAKYGSPHFRPDGELGQEALVPSSVYLSRDRRSVFVGIPDMRPGVMQMQVGWTLATGRGTPAEGDAFLTPHLLAPFEPVAEGFDSVTVDLTPRVLAGQSGTETLTAGDGQKLAEAFACLACHSTDGSPKVGPTWQGLPGRLRKFKGGAQAVADDAYLRESILFSSAKIVAGSDEGMPAYAGILNDQQVSALILYIKSLQTATP
jgi:mono/diheme cytochrome c family protein